VSGRYDFAVREISRSSLSGLASIASRTNVRDDRETPLLMGRDARESAGDLGAGSIVRSAANWHDGQIGVCA